MAAKGGGLIKALDPLLGWMAVRYQRAVGNELRKYGLRYDDLLDSGLNLIQLMCLIGLKAEVGNAQRVPAISSALAFIDCFNLHRYILNNQDVGEALKRIPQHEEDARYQRLKRASDCSLKKSYLPKDVQAQQTPYNFYLTDAIEQVEAENAERAILGTGKTYDRSIP